MLKKTRVETARLCGKSGRPYTGLPEKCSYLVSVGKENFEGTRLEATLGLINAEFTSCDVIVAGTLQRFNLAISENVSLEDADGLSVIQETNWIENAKKILKKADLKCKFNFIRWDEYRKHKNMEELNVAVTELLARREYAVAMEETIDSFCGRHKKMMKREEYEAKEKQIRENSFHFLKEKCAAMFLWRGLIIYPAETPPILEKMREYINEHYGNELKWQSTRFRKVAIASWRDVNIENRENFLDTALFQVSKPEAVPFKVFSNLNSFLHFQTQETAARELQELSINNLNILQLELALMQMKVSLQILSQESQHDTILYLTHNVAPQINELLEQIELLFRKEEKPSKKDTFNAFV